MAIDCESVHNSRNVFMPPTVNCSIATASTKHIIGMPHTRNKTLYQTHWNISIRTLHTDFICSTAQYTFKSKSAGLSRIKYLRTMKRIVTARILLCLL